MTPDFFQLLQIPHLQSILSFRFAESSAGHLRCCVMKSAAEYRAYAEQCIESAKTARSQEACDALLEMARVWIDAAHQLDQLRVVERTTKPEPR
jgi:hypothetical protein